MSAASTPSVSSGQSSYYDALVMQFGAHAANSNVEGSASGSPKPIPAASGDQIGSDQPPRAEGQGSALDQAGDARQKASSLRSLPIEPSDSGQEQYISGMRSTFGSALGRKASVQTTRSTRTTATSAFANGAPLTGPSAEPDIDENMFVRGDKAERLLTQEQKDRITKEEERESRKFSKLLKTESSNEKVALDSALKNLSALQSLHKGAIKRESKAELSHARALSAAQKAESRFQEEKARAAEVRAHTETRCMEEHARWEGREGELRAQQERLEAARQHVRETETRIAKCAHDVERLRIIKAMDERERGAKLTELIGKK